MARQAAPWRQHDGQQQEQEQRTSGTTDSSNSVAGLPRDTKVFKYSYACKVKNIVFSC